MEQLEDFNLADGMGGIGSPGPPPTRSERSWAFDGRERWRAGCQIRRMLRRRREDRQAQRVQRAPRTARAPGTRRSVADDRPTAWSGTADVRPPARRRLG